MKSNEHSVFDPASDEVFDTRPLHVDVGDLLKAKVPQHFSRIPKWLISCIKRIIHQDELNEFLHLYGHLRGADFAEALIQHLDININVRGLDNIPANDSRLIFSCNHPLGALDGIAIISLLGHKYPGNFRFIVNDMLMVIPTLAPIFLPVNKHGAQSRNAAATLSDCMTDDFAIATFPAGLCSRNTHGNVIEDLPWKKTFISCARHYNRTVVPMHFSGRNSSAFYRLAKLRKFLGIKLNIEMVLLPREIFKCKGKQFTITFGKPIPGAHFDTAHTDTQWAAILRDITYSLQ